MSADFDDPRALAAFVRRRAPMTPGTLTSTMGRTDHPIGLFLRELTRAGTGSLPTFPADRHPQLVAPDVLGRGEHATIGTAFGWWFRLHVDPYPSLVEAQVGRDVLPPHVQIALWELDTWILSGAALAEPHDHERVAVVLAWCEQLYRAGPGALNQCPMLQLRPGAGLADVLDLVADHLVDQLLRLGDLAQARLLATISAGTQLRHGCLLGRHPIGADADLVLGDTLLELKCGQGTRRPAGMTFRLTVDLVRQLLGYLLLDVDDKLAARSVGVYAARFGLLWVMPATELITAVGGPRTDLDTLREAFAMLWDVA